MSYACDDLELAAEKILRVEPSGDGCEECLANGTQWVHLRICTTCGHVGCCDNSEGKHATQHFHETNHPVIRSYEPGEDWAYCYSDEEYAQHLPEQHEGAAAHG